MSVVVSDDRGRCIALRQAWFLSENYARLFAVSSGVGLSERTLRNHAWSPIADSTVVTIRGLGHRGFVDRGLSRQHLPLSASGDCPRIARHSFGASVVARSVDLVGLLVHKTIQCQSTDSQFRLNNRERVITMRDQDSLDADKTIAVMWADFWR